MKKVALITSLILGLSIVTWFVFLNNAIPDIKPIYKTVEIKSKIEKESIFLKQKVWGMTSDNNTIIISKSSKNDFEISNESDYVFKGYSTFLYRHNQDSLIVYISHKVIPTAKMVSKFKIVQIELTNSEMMNLLANDSYKKKGLILF